MCGMKKYKPTSPARRQAEYLEFRSFLTRQKPSKQLTFWRKRAHGRNAFGRITTRHKGGGAKRLWREIDFLYDKRDVPARVESIEYDPNRTSFIALLLYTDGEKRYALAPHDIRIGDRVIISENAPIERGNRTLLSKIPVGTTVYNVELKKGRGAKLARSAGVGALVLAHENNYTHLKLPSKEVRMVRQENWASIGSLSNSEHKFLTLGNAGRSRHLGIRPAVRGTAMNPVDHPHGGGEGRTLLGRRRGPATPWGKPARGVKTRKRRKRSNRFILQRRRK